MSTRPWVAASAMALVAVVVPACGQSSTGTGPTSTPTPRASASPSPSTPDTEEVSVVASGVGAWQLVAIPVAIVRNGASHHGAEEVVVHFTTHNSRGATLGSLDSAAVNLGPGETLPVAADCTDGCNNASRVDATLSVGLWTSTTGASFSAGQASYRCGAGACGGGHGEGTATATLTTNGLGANAPVAAFAACFDATGSIVGGGVTQTFWPGGTSSSINVPVIVNRAPATCQVGASTGW